MAYQDTGKHVVAFMILALVLSFAALIALWAMGSIPTTSYPQIIEKQKSPAGRQSRPGFRALRESRLFAGATGLYRSDVKNTPG